MQRTLYRIACIVVILAGTHCAPARPTTTASETTSTITATASLAPTMEQTPVIDSTPSPTSVADGQSGIEGVTSSFVVSGVPGGETTGGPASVEFAIAPVESGEPNYARAIFVVSDAQGIFRVELPPGTYWIGPREKALDPANYTPGAVVFSEMIVEVEPETFLFVELSLTGYAP